MKFKKVKDFAAKRVIGRMAKAVPIGIRNKLGVVDYALVQGNRAQARGEYFKHIDKALNGKASGKEEKEWWIKARKQLFDLVHEKPNEATLFYRKWLETFPDRIERGQVEKQDIKNLKLFKEYIQSCYSNALSLYLSRKQEVFGDGAEKN